MSVFCAYCDDPIDLLKTETYEALEYTKYGQLHVEYYCIYCIPKEAVKE